MKTCQVSAVRLDGVPVSSAAAESCGKVFRAKSLSVEIRFYSSKGRKRQTDGEKSDPAFGFLSERPICLWSFLFFLVSVVLFFFFLTKENDFYFFLKDHKCENVKP